MAPGSRVETFAAMRLAVETWRWQGVPFYIRADVLPETCTEVFATFKRPPAIGHLAPSPNYLRFRLTPEFGIGLSVQVMGPGQEPGIVPVELKVDHQETPDEISPYERLFGEALKGDQSLFAREDTVELAWKVVGPALAGEFPVHPYEPNTWGPAEAGSIPLGGTEWHDPVITGLG